MKLRDLLFLILLGSIWGAGFMFTRMAAAPFGPTSLILLRVGIAALCLLPLAFLRHEQGAMRAHWVPLLVSGLLNAAAPFCLFAYASLSLTAGFTALLNAVTPLMTAVIGAAFYGQRLRPSQWLGLALSIIGVAVLCWGKLSFKPGGSGWAIVAVLCATFCYGWAAHYSRRRFAGVSPLAISTGSMAAASLMMLVPGSAWWPAVSPSLTIWGAVAGLGAACTAAAFLIYFYLLGAIGPTQAASVTFLVPLFAMFWSVLLLHEAVTGQMLLASVIIIAGTALVNGLITFGRFGAATARSS